METKSPIMEMPIVQDEQYTSYVRLIRQVLTHLFSDLSEADWRKLASNMEEVDLPSGYYLFREGDRGDALYIVISGRLQVRLENEEQVQVIAEIGRGETVGEMALITGENRSASIYAIRDCRLMRISKAAFNDFFTQFPAVGLNLSKLIIGRFTQKQVNRRHRSIRNIAVLALHRSIDLQETVDQLEQTLKKNGKRVQLISSAYIDSELGEGVAETSIQQAEANKKLSIWLDNMEITQDQVLYLADPGATEWTKRCIRQADEILLFADAAASPGLTQLEQTVLSGEGRLSAARQTLVLLQPGGEALPVNTARWLRLRNVGFHVHIRADRQERDFGRLCRYLTDKLVGLVLAGGGAKGFAHIGVWRALEEADIPVDFIGGTSMGSMVGGLLACDWNHEKVFAICKEIASSPLKSDFNLLPVISLFKGKILDRVLQKYFLDKDIEDCPLPFYCVSSNMTQAAPMVHRSGNMFHAIRASGSIPAVVPPVVDRQGLLIDGGIFNNFPTDIMIDMGAQYIIGVDFLVDQNKEIMFGEMPSSWKALRRRWFGGPQSKSLPTLLSTIIESTTLYSAFMQKQNSENTDIYINPDVNQFGMLDWAGYDKIVQKGYEEAKRVLDEYSEQLEEYVN